MTDTGAARCMYRCMYKCRCADEYVMLLDSRRWVDEAMQHCTPINNTLSSVTVSHLLLCFHCGFRFSTQSPKSSCVASICLILLCYHGTATIRFLFCTQQSS